MVRERADWLLLLVIGSFACWTGFTASGETPWADSVSAYHAIHPNTGFDTPEKSLGEPVGGGVSSPGNSSLHSIGTPGSAPGSYILLKFNTPVTDDPSNRMGLDAIVYGNGMYVGGDPQRKMAEAGLIEISADVNGNGIPDDPWYVIPGSRNLRSNLLPAGIPNPTPPLCGNVLNPLTNGAETDWGYADLSPTQRKYLDNYVRPDDPKIVGLTPRSGGGDAFDIAWAVDSNGQPAQLTEFSFIRISTIVADSSSTFGDITTEIDAVADVAPDVDVDADGILDEYETRVAGTDPLRAENTVLALEIPSEEGDSAAGVALGEARDGAGNGIRFYSAGLRTGVRNNNCVVDILPQSDPGGTIPGKLKSGSICQFLCGESDFRAAQIQDAEFTMTYSATAIAGLDEIGLQPYRFSGGTYTQEGIDSLLRDTQNNRVTFRSRYPGIFVLASVAGSGDTNTGGGSITLTADVPSVEVGAPGGVVTIVGDPIVLPGGMAAPDGTPFTVSTSLGYIVTPDVDAVTPGVQVHVLEGELTFQVQAEAVAGAPLVTVVSLDGTINQQITSMFLPGMALGPVELWLLNEEATAPGPIVIGTGVISDAYGNPLVNGTLVTVEVEGGSIETPDKSPLLPGHQLAVNGGSVTFPLRAETASGEDYAVVTVFLYADADETELLGSETWSFDVVVMPLCVSLILVVFLGMAGGFLLYFRTKDREAD